MFQLTTNQFQPTANQVLNKNAAANQPQDGNTPQQAELRAIWVLQLLARQAESHKQYGNRHPLEVSEIGQKFFPKH